MTKSCSTDDKFTKNVNIDVRGDDGGKRKIEIFLEDIECKKDFSDKTIIEEFEEKDTHSNQTFFSKDNSGSGVGYWTKYCGVFESSWYIQRTGFCT